MLPLRIHADPSCCSAIPASDLSALEWLLEPFTSQISNLQSRSLHVLLNIFCPDPTTTPKPVRAYGYAIPDGMFSDIRLKMVTLLPPKPAAWGRRNLNLASASVAICVYAATGLHPPTDGLLRQLQYKARWPFRNGSWLGVRPVGTLLEASSRTLVHIRHTLVSS
ncbi:hypothetical protein OE88DRAFT_837580 [Heliocybe sulcata]|uniref:Uncharacterized protein n=1 Tax=Heliocybe sulcata TaxID=5364 RepID=A0A5C3MPU9_9AGAM|nr:hypothetical protein OE88DRAFT_837580 [Heliocybe sulcata]